MKPEEYTGSEWQYLLKQMDGKEIKKSLRSAIRAEAKKAQKIAQDKLDATDLQVQGNTADWKKGIRTYIYNPNRATGVMVTVKARAASRKTGKGEKSMHQNRKGFKKPVLMWAEEGTQPRKRGGKRVKADNAHNTAKAQGRIGGAWQYIRKGGIKTGRMKPYRFLERATPEMFQAVEAGLTPEVGRAVENVARKCGFI